MKYLLAGNPNVGKSTLFNMLTESNVHIGNWSGVTVESRTHKIKGLQNSDLMDLPGTYGVSPSSEDEGVVTTALIHQHYNGIINIVDSTHIKRNLHLTMQLLELGVPVVLVANMFDELEKSGYKIDIEKLEKLLNINVVGLTAKNNNREDKEKLLYTIEHMKIRKGLHIDYGPIIEKAIIDIRTLLRHESLHVKKRWLAIQLLEGNEGIFKAVELKEADQIKNIIQKTEELIIKEKIALSLKGAIFNVRREYINQIVSETLIQVHDKNHMKYYNKRIDNVVTHPIWGILVFLLVMLTIYHISFDAGILGIGNWLTVQFEAFYNHIFIPFLGDVLSWMGITGFLYNLVIEGIASGVGGVIVFLPQILVLFFLLAVLEGTGYMARVAIVMDGFLSKFGYNGKSIVPLVTGFGCSVPAVMATRTIPDKKERILTILTIPFISCSARLPIYAMFVRYFFRGNYASLVLMGIYLLGIIVALTSAKLFSLTIFKGSNNKFALEMPPYRIPQFRTILTQALDRAKAFIKKAGTFILIGSMVLWYLSYMGPNGISTDQSESFLALIGNSLRYVFIPLGFGTWQATTSLFSGILAKEVVVASLLVIYNAGDAGFSVVATHFTTPAALSFVVFSALYIPCLATLGVIKSETKSWKWTLFAVIYPFTVAWIVAFIIYQIALLF